MLEVSIFDDEGEGVGGVFEIFVVEDEAAGAGVGVK